MKFMNDQIILDKYFEYYDKFKNNIYGDLAKDYITFPLILSQVFKFEVFYDLNIYLFLTDLGICSILQLTNRDMLKMYSKSPSDNDINETFRKFRDHYYIIATNMLNELAEEKNKEGD